MGVKFQSRVTERTEDSITTTIVWNGTHEEMTAAADDMPVGSCSADGRLMSIRVYQESPLIWHCERRFTLAADGELVAGAPQDTAYGRKSAQLRGSMLSLPLEKHPNYLARWNYYLAAAPDISTIPDWWEKAKDTVLDHAESQKYAWIKTPGELPNDKKGRWHILKDPVKPGVESYDIAVYVVTETARFRSPQAAGKMIAGHLNRIGRPDEDFGIKRGEWKCDDASVSYNGKDWLATLSWTLSGDESGWDKELYN